MITCLSDCCLRASAGSKKSNEQGSHGLWPLQMDGMACAWDSNKAGAAGGSDPPHCAADGA